MTIICPYCQTEMPIKDYDLHTAQAHPEQAERRALLSIESAEKQVEYIYDHHPETKQDNGLLLLYFAKGYPKLNLFDEGSNYIIKAKYDDFFYFLKRANSITRLGRHIRQPKKTGEELIAYSNPLKTSIKTKDAVKQVLEQIPHLNISIRQPIILTLFCPLLRAEIILNLALLHLGAFCKWVLRF